jgi:hypothetical protein
VRYLTAAELVDTLYPGLPTTPSAGSSTHYCGHNRILIVGVGFAPLDENAAQLLLRVVAVAYERRPLGYRLSNVPIARHQAGPRAVEDTRIRYRTANDVVLDSGSVRRSIDRSRASK